MSEEIIKLSKSSKLSNETIIFDNTHSIGTLLSDLQTIYLHEAANPEVQFLLNLKSLPTEMLVEAVRYSLSYEELTNPSMILNILNLLKVYNSLDTSFFENENIYVSSIEELLDLKLALSAEIKSFKRKISIYFLSLFKSYNKISYSPTDTHCALPLIYKRLFLVSDILTLAGIFSTTENINTAECMYIEDGVNILSNLLFKSALSIDLLTEMLETKK